MCLTLLTEPRIWQVFKKGPWCKPPHYEALLTLLKVQGVKPKQGAPN